MHHSQRRPPSAGALPRPSMRPSSALRMGLLSSALTGSGTGSSSNASSISHAVRAQPWSGSVLGGVGTEAAGSTGARAGGVAFMSRHSSSTAFSAGQPQQQQQHHAFVLDSRLLQPMAAWVDEARAFLHELETGNSAAAATTTAVEPVLSAFAAAAVESASLSLAVRLLINLSHHAVHVRAGCATLVLRLAEALSAAPVGSSSAVEALLQRRRAVAASGILPANKHMQELDPLHGMASSSASSSRGGGATTGMDASERLRERALRSERHAAIVAAFLVAGEGSGNAASSSRHCDDEDGRFEALRVFFALMGPGTLAPMAVSLVERLESQFYVSTSADLRDAAVRLAALLMHSHPNSFFLLASSSSSAVASAAVPSTIAISFRTALLPSPVHSIGAGAGAGAADNGMVGVWNLFFLLDMLSAASYSNNGDGPSQQQQLLSGTRTAVLQALALLAPSFVPSNPALGHQVAARVLALAEKSAREVRAAKRVLLAIGNACAAQAAALLAGAVAQSSSSSNSAAATPERAASPAAAMAPPATSFAAFSAAAAAAAAAASPAAAAAAQASSFSLFPTFLSSLSAHREAQYDLLEWAVFAYTINMQNNLWNANIKSSGIASASTGRAASAHPQQQQQQQQLRPILSDVRDMDALFFESHAASSVGNPNSSGSSSVPSLRLSTLYPADLLRVPSSSVSLPSELGAFLATLEAHLRAGTAPAIRWGAALALGQVLRVYPSVLAWSGATNTAQQSDQHSSAISSPSPPLLYAHILWGLLDEHVHTRATYEAMLSHIARGLGCDKLSKLLARYRSANASVVRNNNGNSGDGGGGLSGLDDLEAVLDVAVSLAPALPSRFLAFVCSTLSSVSSPRLQLATLHLLTAWSRQLEEIEHVFMAQLLSLLELAAPVAASSFTPTGHGHAYAFQQLSVAPEVPARVMELLRSLPAKALTSLSDTHLHALAAFFQRTLDPSSSSSAAAARDGLSSGRVTSRSAADSVSLRAAAAAAYGDEAHPGSGGGPSSWHNDPVLHDLQARVLGCLPCFPFERLGPRVVEGFLDALVSHVLLHPSVGVRRAAYDMLGHGSGGGVRLFGPHKVLLRRCCALSLAALGDAEPDNVLVALQSLITLLQAYNRSYAAGEAKDGRRDVLLAELRSPLRQAQLAQRNLAARLPAYDALARTIVLHSQHIAAATQQPTLAALRECILAGEELKPFVTRLFGGLGGDSAMGAAVAATSSATTDPTAGGDGAGEIIAGYRRGVVAQHPHWWALLCSHMGLLHRRKTPMSLLLPLLSSTASVASASLNADADGLQSADHYSASSQSSGSIDRSVRLATAHALKRACVVPIASSSSVAGGGSASVSSAGVLNDRLINAIVEILPAMLSPAAPSSEQEAGYTLMHVLSPLRLRGFNHWCLVRFLPAAVERLASSSMSSGLREALMLFLESAIMLHPRSSLPWMETARNALRELLCRVGANIVHNAGGRPAGHATTSSASAQPHANANQLTLISRLYSLVCFTGSLYAPLRPRKSGSDGDGTSSTTTADAAAAAAMDYFKYLQADLSALSAAATGDEMQLQLQPSEHHGAARRANTTAGGDPLLSNLNAAQRRVVILVSLQALGCLDGGGRTLVGPILDTVVPFLCSPDACVRFHALEALQLQVPLLDASGAAEAALARWVSAVLLADPNAAVRVLLASGSHGASLVSPLPAQLSDELRLVHLVRRRIERLGGPEGADDAFDSVPERAALAAVMAFEQPPVAFPASAEAMAALARGAEDDAEEPTKPFHARLDEDVFAVPLHALQPEQGGDVDGGAEPSGGLTRSSLTAFLATPSMGAPFFQALQRHLRSASCPFPPSTRVEELLYHLARFQRLGGGGGVVAGGAAGGSLAAAALLVQAEVCHALALEGADERAAVVLQDMFASMQVSLASPTARTTLLASVLGLQALCCARTPRKWSVPPVSLFFEHVIATAAASAAAFAEAEDDDEFGRMPSSSSSSPSAAAAPLREGILVALRSVLAESKVDLSPLRGSVVRALSACLRATLHSSRTSDAGLSLVLEVMALLVGRLPAGGPAASDDDEDERDKTTSHVDTAAALLEHMFALLARRLVASSSSSLSSSSSSSSSSSAADQSRFHDNCASALRRILASLPDDHALLARFEQALESDVRSPRVELRLRAATTLGMLANRLPFARRLAHWTRLLADPLPAVKKAALAAVLDPARGAQIDRVLLPIVKTMLGEVVGNKRASSSLKTGADVSADAVPLEHLSDQQLHRLLDEAQDTFAMAQRQDRERGGGAGGAGDDTASSTTAGPLSGLGLGQQQSGLTDSSQPRLRIPLEDHDPANARYLRSEGFVRWLRAYGLWKPPRGPQRRQVFGVAQPSGGAVSAAAMADERPWTAERQLDAYTVFQQLTSEDGAANAHGSADSSATAAAAAAGSASSDEGGEEDQPTVLERLSPARRQELLASIRALRAAHLDFAPLLGALVAQDAGAQADALITQLLAHFEDVPDANNVGVATTTTQKNATTGAAATKTPDVASKPKKTKGKTPATTDTPSSATSSAGTATTGAPPAALDMADKLHTLGVTINLLSAFVYCCTTSTPPFSSAARAAAGGAGLSASDREAVASKLSAALATLQGCCSRFKRHAESLRTRVLAALGDLAAFRGPSSATRWGVPPRGEKAFRQREHYETVMMAPPNAHTAGGGSGGTGATTTATIDPVTGLPMSKQGLLEHMRLLEARVALWTAEVGRTTALQIVVVRAVSRVLEATSSASSVAAGATKESGDGVIAPSSSLLIPGVIGSDSLVSTFHWLGSMFADQHRGVRLAVREGMEGLVAARCIPATTAVTATAAATSSPDAAGTAGALEKQSSFVLLVHRTVFALWKSLKEHSAPHLDGSSSSATSVAGQGLTSLPAPEWLHRRRPRADLVALLGGLVRYSPHSKLRRDVLDLLVALWDDADHAVRAQAIQAVHKLLMLSSSSSSSLQQGGRYYFPEADALVNVAQGGGGGGGALSNRSAPLVKAVLSRTRDPDYPDKDKLNALLSWYFAAHA